MQPVSLAVAILRRVGGGALSRGRIARTKAAEAIQAATGVKVEPNQVELLDGEVRVSVSGARRAALFLRRDEAAAAVAAALGDDFSREVR